MKLSSGAETALCCRVSYGDKKEVFVFEDNNLHTLLRWSDNRGQYYELYKDIFME